MVGSLGDAFPKSYRNQFSEDKIIPGTVICAHVQDTKPPKTKRFIIVGIDESNISLATVYLNSEININMFPTEELRDLHILLTKDSREYLDRDSYVDCSAIVIRDREEVLNLIKNNPKVYIGKASQEDMRAIRAKIKQSRLVSIKKKKKYGLFY